ncbi:HNH endonuclease [Paenibacillus sp. N3/727]|uniref:HNH endonuclease n=1 Tax=Paenibacillus sp. N3/727 TaxID=2925845 RepID=UPI001F53410D|nr:HNH endonuclease [Paenibacillus sp. N3/727]UNK18230.1 HNH endonuclease [Paenibacillus sp. N3/727]
MNGIEQSLYKQCGHCGMDRPLSEFRRRTGRRSGPNSRRGICAECRRLASEGISEAILEKKDNPVSKVDSSLVKDDAASSLEIELLKPKASRSQKRRAARKRAKTRAAEAAIAAKCNYTAGQQLEHISPKRGEVRKTGDKRKHTPPNPPRPLLRTAVAHEHLNPYDVSSLVPTRAGTIRMRGRTDKGRGWHQEIDPELAIILVKENAAVVVNRHTIRRLYTNKGFRKYVLERDRHTCYFCGGYGDTIDHLLPRAKGGHTTPVNCVCACMECNQSKADRDLDDFMNLSR